MNNLADTAQPAALIDAQVCWALAYSLFFLGLSILVHRPAFGSFLGSLRLPAWASSTARWTACAFVLLLLLDEGGLLLREIGVDDPGGLFAFARYCMGIPLIAELQIVLIHVLTITFVFELERVLRLGLPLSTKVHTWLFLVSMTLATHFFQLLLWNTAQNFGHLQPSTAAVPIFYILMAAASFFLLLLSAKEPTRGMSFMEAERHRILVRGFLCFALMIPLSQTLVSRAIFLWFVFEQTLRLAHTLVPGFRSFNWAERWRNLLSEIQPRHYWLLEAHFALGLAAILPLAVLWRVLLSPYPPTVSFYQYPVAVSAGLSFFIVVFVFVTKSGALNVRGLAASLLAYIGSYLLFPLSAHELLAIDVVFQSPLLLDTLGWLHVIGPLAAVAALATWLIFTVFMREAHLFVLSQGPWKRFQNRTLLYHAATLMGAYLVSFPVLLAARYGYIQSVAGSLSVGVAVAVGVFFSVGPWALHATCFCLHVQRLGRTVLRGYWARLSMDRESAKALASRFPFVEDVPESIQWSNRRSVTSKIGAPEFSQFSRRYKLLFLLPFVISLFYGIAVVTAN